MEKAHHSLPADTYSCLCPSSHAPAPSVGAASACISLVAKRADATGTGEAGACAEPAGWRCGTPQGQRAELLRRDCAEPRYMAVVFKRCLTKTLRSTRCKRALLFQGEPVARWPPQDGQPALMLQECFGRCCGSTAASGRTARADGEGLKCNARTRPGCPGSNRTMSHGISDSALHTMHERPNV